LILQVDALMTPARQAFIREVHPKLVFALASRRAHGVAEPKRTAAGERVRLRLLRPASSPPDGSPRGKALVLPAGGVERDTRGLRMEIVA
jgi:Protein of unknown function (DUF429)